MSPSRENKFQQTLNFKAMIQKERPDKEYNLPQEEKTIAKRKRKKDVLEEKPTEHHVSEILSYKKEYKQIISLKPTFL